jgi:hypothetical protein
VRSCDAERSLRHLRPRGPAWLRVLLVTLLTSAALAAVIAALDWWAGEFVGMILPGRPDRLGLAWTLGLAGAGGLAAAAALEWGTWRGVRRAAERAVAGDPIGAVRQLAESTGHGLEHSATAVRAYLDERAATRAQAEPPEEVRRLAGGGEPLRAAERLRELTGCGIEEALRRVESYLAGRAADAE